MIVSTDGHDGAAGQRLELRISVSATDGDRDLVVRTTASDRVSALVQALAIEVGDPGEQRLWCERRGELLDGDLELGAAGIRWGDRLSGRGVCEPTHVGGSARVELLIQRRAMCGRALCTR